MCKKFQRILNPHILNMSGKNVIDKYKEWTHDLICEDVVKNTLPFAVCMEHIIGDFNIGSILRSANAFGAEKMFYLGKKKWDRRGAVGVQNYTSINHINMDELSSLKKEYTLIALENINGAVSLTNFVWPARPLIIVGEEGSGLSESILNESTSIVEIEMRGSVRSFNAAVAASIAMYDFVSKLRG